MLLPSDELVPGPPVEELEVVMTPGPEDVEPGSSVVVPELVPSGSRVADAGSLDVADVVDEVGVAPPVGTQTFPAGVNSAKRRPLSHSGSAKLQPPSVSHTPCAPHCASELQT